MNEIVLGRGMLNWPAGERRSDRYGMIALFATAEQKPGLLLAESVESETLEPKRVQPHLGRRGKLVARVLETRHSDHIGDLVRGFHPTTPEVGELIKLGEGELVEEHTGFPGIDYVVGLKPTDGRAVDWLDPRKLYRAHIQTVELLFIPE